MKKIILDSSEEFNELLVNKGNSEKISRKDKLKEIYFIILLEGKTEKSNDFTFSNFEHKI